MYLSNREIIKATQIGKLPNLPMLDATTITAQICEHINDMPLVTLEKMFDEGCEAKVTKKL